MTTYRERQLEIWNRMTPQERDYDRFVGKIPTGASWNCETEEGKEALERRRDDRGYSVYEEGCSCHINPPCGYCERINYDEN